MARIKPRPLIQEQKETTKYFNFFALRCYPSPQLKNNTDFNHLYYNKCKVCGEFFLGEKTVYICRLCNENL